MMRFKLQPEPVDWDARCRKRGQAWLASHPCYKHRPRSYWTEFEPELREAFAGLCAYLCMLVPKANMDHFLPIDHLKAQGKDHLAYEWSNFRYVEGIMNQRKLVNLVLDPFQVKDDWFEILLPSLQLVLTDKVPKSKRVVAEFTLRKLGLTDSEVVIRYRREWYSMYQRGELTLDGLRRVAPLIAAAVVRTEAAE